MVKKLELPQTHYPTTKSLAKIMAKQMGTSVDPDAYLKNEKPTTDKEKISRDANVAARVDGAAN